MDYYVVIPAHNEEAYLAQMLNSLLEQTLLPKKVVIVNDNSTDGTEVIIDTFLEKTSKFQKLNRQSSKEHMPGSKVIAAFEAGLKLLDNNYDFIVKLDADLILPPNYFETIATHFTNNENLGIVGGFIYEQNTLGNWVLNHPMDKDHIRGALKAYSKNCFKAINGLKTAMGWDTIDELLARLHNYNLLTDENLKVKHLRPTGKSYNPKAKKLQGQAMYAMRYGFWITCIASLKMSLINQSTRSFLNNMSGYINAKKNRTPFIVSEKEGEFVRSYRWQNIKQKIIKKAI